MWMTAEMKALLDAGATPEQVRVDISLKRMKPLLVKWMMTAWKQLRTRDAMIRKGWDKAGLGEVTKSDVQRESLRQASVRKLFASQIEGEEDDPTASVCVELEDDMDDADVEDDEDELNVDMCLAAAIEDKPMVLRLLISIVVLLSV
jgi:hypothetical protein